MTVNAADAGTAMFAEARDTSHTREFLRDLLVVATGVALVLLSLWVPVQGDEQITATILILGMVAYSAGLWAMTTESRTSHWGLVVLGSALLLAPLVMVFPSGTTIAAVVSVTAGAIVAAAGVLGLMLNRDDSVPRHGR